MLVNAMIHNQQRTFGREHTDAQIGIFRNALTPNPGGVNDNRCMQGLHFARQMIAHVNAANRRAFANQSCHFMRR
ncbi:hypothetical protein SDC9_186377 [bioreactor metagenome]|uniref:Uncharacterized protein n=1 Tax=bioreactor metagenome TaxID=1076179 RepID=A0A645HKD2_9ZZZZ